MAEKHRRSMDENATRFLLFFRRYALRNPRLQGRRPGITWREIAWAFFSASQEILVDLVSRHFQSKVLWEQAKESGVFMWMGDITAVVSVHAASTEMGNEAKNVQRSQFEVIARNEYTKTDEKNPVDCSIYYLALKKKNVLLGLWRMAAWHREQVSTQRLLSNDFSEPRWKTAALKNAYALLGKRRFGEYRYLRHVARFLKSCRVRSSILLARRKSTGRCECLRPADARHSAGNRRGACLRRRWWTGAQRAYRGQSVATRCV